MKCMICRILLFVFLITCCTPPSWAQRVQHSRRAIDIVSLQRLVSDEVVAQTRANYNDRIAQAQHELDDAMEYKDIMRKSSNLRKIYNERHEYEQNLKNINEALAQSQQMQVHPNDAIQAPPRPILPHDPHRSEVLAAQAANTLTPEKLLDFIDPMDPDKDDWKESSYAAQILTNTITSTQETYPGLEQYLRHAQIRIMHRLFQLDINQGDPSFIRAEAAGQLRLAMMALHLNYKKLYGDDPLSKIISAEQPPKRSPRPLHIPDSGYRSIEIVGGVSSAAGSAGASRPRNENIYQRMRSDFMREIYHWKNELPSDPYTFTKLVNVLKGRNITDDFSFGEATGDVVVNDILFFIPLAKSLGEWIFGSSDTRTPTTNLTITAPLAVQYDLVADNFEHIKKIVRAVEPVKLAENAREGIFKNDDMYQSTQPVIAEIFNTLYIYALTPGRTQKEWMQVMDLLIHFSDPKKYSIMTRISAIATAAKLMDLRYTAANPSPFEEANGNTEGIEHLKNFMLPTKTILPGTRAQASTIFDFNDPNYIYQSCTGRTPYAYADVMAQRIADIYAALLRGHLAGTQDYGLGAKQTKILEDELAKLYNIFQREVTDQQRYPKILPAANANLETRMEYRDGKSYKQEVLYSYGARVALTGGGTVDMNLDNPVQSHFDKDAGEFMSTFLVDVVTWKFLVGLVRVGVKGVRAAKTLIMPKGTKLVLSSNFAPTGIRAGTVFRVDQTAFKAGINATTPEAQTALKNAQELAGLTIPDAATATRAEVCRFLNIPENASEATFNRALRAMKGKYHPDRFEKYITPQVQQQLSEKAGSLAALGDFANPAGRTAARATGAAAVPTGPKLLTDRATPEMTHWEKVAEAARARASQVPQGPVDYNSWVNITKGFAKFFAVDYALSYVNLPLEEHMQKAAMDDAQNMYTPQKYGNNQTDKQDPIEPPLALFDEISEAADPQRMGAIIRLPINLGKLALGSDILGAEVRAQMSLAQHQQEFNNASIAGNVKQYQATLQKEMDSITEALNSFLNTYAHYIEALPTAQQDITRAFNNYKAALQQASALADTNLQQAQELAQKAGQEMINTRADIVIRCIQAYWPGQVDTLIKQRIDWLHQNYPQLATAEDEAQVTRLMQAYAHQQQALQTRWFTLSKNSAENQEQMQAVDAQFKQVEQQTKQAWDQLTLRIGLDSAVKNMEISRINFLWANRELLAALPTAQKEMKQVYSTYIQDLKRARNVVETDLDQALQIENEAMEKFTNSRASIMISVAKAYWPNLLNSLVYSYTSQLQQQFINNLSIVEMGEVQNLLQEYCARRQELDESYWQLEKQSSKSWEEIQAQQEQITQHVQQADAGLNQAIEQLINRIQQRFEADPWLSFVQSLYLEGAQELEAAFPQAQYRYKSGYSNAITIYQSYLEDIQAALEALDPQNPDKEAFNAAKAAAKQKRDKAWQELKGFMRWQQMDADWQRTHPSFQPAVQ